MVLLPSQSCASGGRYAHNARVLLGVGLGKPRPTVRSVVPEPAPVLRSMVSGRRLPCGGRACLTCSHLMWQAGKLLVEGFSRVSGTRGGFGPLPERGAGTRGNARPIPEWHWTSFAGGPGCTRGGPGPLLWFLSVSPAEGEVRHRWSAGAGPDLRGPAAQVLSCGYLITTWH